MLADLADHKDVTVPPDLVTRALIVRHKLEENPEMMGRRELAPRQSYRRGGVEMVAYLCRKPPVGISHRSSTTLTPHPPVTPHSSTPPPWGPLTWLIERFFKMLMGPFSGAFMPSELFERALMQTLSTKTNATQHIFFQCHDRGVEPLYMPPTKI